MNHQRIHSILLHLPAKRIWIEISTQNLVDHRIDSVAIEMPKFQEVDQFTAHTHTHSNGKYTTVDYCYHYASDNTSYKLKYLVRERRKMNWNVLISWLWSVSQCPKLNKHIIQLYTLTWIWSKPIDVTLCVWANVQKIDAW